MINKLKSLFRKWIRYELLVYYVLQDNEYCGNVSLESKVKFENHEFEFVNNIKETMQEQLNCEISELIVYLIKKA